MLLIIAISLYVLAVVVDAVTTYIGIKHFGAKETNWLFKGIAARTSLSYFIRILVIVKLSIIPFAIYMSGKSNIYAAILLAGSIAYWRIPIHNIIQIRAKIKQQHSA